MVTHIPFTKMHGAGNDFILIDNRQEFFSGDETELFRNLCRRHFGIGADGLLLIQFWHNGEFDVAFFNPDGKPAAMCGNGARCAVYLMHLRHPGFSKFTISFTGKKYLAEITGKEQVRLFWEEKPQIKTDAPVENLLPGIFSNALLIDAGVPHLVVKSNIPLKKIDVAKWGKYFRNHKLFGSAGTNVNFIETGDTGIKIRTYERGVEGETLACGSGALAAVAAVWYWGETASPVEVWARGGHLRVGKYGKKKILWLEGPAKKVFSGRFSREAFEFPV